MKNTSSRLTLPSPGQLQGPAPHLSFLLPSPSCNVFIQVSLLQDSELLGNKDCAFLISVVLAQANMQPKVGIKIMDFEVNLTGLGDLVTVQPWPHSLLYLLAFQFPEHSL